MILRVQMEPAGRGPDMFFRVRGPWGEPGEVGWCRRTEARVGLGVGVSLET